jgi:hypothetical protein
VAARGSRSPRCRTSVFSGPNADCFEDLDPFAGLGTMLPGESATIRIAAHCHGEGLLTFRTDDRVNATVCVPLRS